MKTLTIMALIVGLSPMLSPAQSIANVIGRKDLILTIDRGGADGVQPGMTGIIKATYDEPGLGEFGEYSINIGIFTVEKVKERSAELSIKVGKGLNPADARYVVFDKELVPAESLPEKPGRAETPKSAAWHLNEGDKAADAGDYRAALTHYRKSLELEPGNLVAQEKLQEMNKAVSEAERRAKFKEYLKKADLHYEQNKVKFAFLYLVEALRLYPEGKEDIRRRLAVMNREYPLELAAILKEKAGELKELRAEIDALLPKPGEPGPGPVEKMEEKTVFSEPYLKQVAPKAKKIARNSSGAWEAVFMDDITMVYIPEGEFTIGSPAQEGEADEHPARKVFISGFWIGKTEVTFAQYDRFCAETRRARADDEGWGRDKRPAIYVSWTDASDYCAWLEKKTGLKFRLPSEAEWEKTAHGRFPWGGTPPDATRANFNKDHLMTRPVGSYPAGASPQGVLDMAGNVWEWTADWYHPDYSQVSRPDRPGGPATGSVRSVRGGSWANGSNLVRSANRSQEKPESRLNILGFRLALDGH